MGETIVTDRHSSGDPDICTYLDLNRVSPISLPPTPEITTITELDQGVATARDADTRGARNEQPGAALVEFDPLLFAKSGHTLRLTGRAERSRHNATHAGWMC